MNILHALFAVVLATTTVAAKPTWQQLDSYTFEQFLNDFAVKFPAEELQTRRNLFERELLRVKKHNAGNFSWKEGINRFSVMTVEERKSFFGYSKNHAVQHKKAKVAAPVFNQTAVNERPASVDWRESGIATAVKDQGHCGSCWSFASTATIESHVALSSGLLFDLSVQQMAMCAPNPDSCGGTGGCEGSTAELAFEYVSGSKGLYEEYQVPYTSYYGVDTDCSTPTLVQPVATIDGYTKLPNNDYESVMNAVATVGPLAVNVDASTWHAYESGIYDGCNNEQPDVNHVVVLMGYGEEDGQLFWLVRNSWSASYGEAGYIRIARQSAAEEPCGTDITPTDGVECEGDNTPVEVCGTCGVIYDASYPLNAVAL